MLKMQKGNTFSRGLDVFFVSLILKSIKVDSISKNNSQKVHGIASFFVYSMKLA
jgi:hypothetical protein